MKLKLTILTTLLVAFGALAHAEEFTTVIPLEGSQEVTAPTSPGTGSATVFIDTDANTITVVGAYSGMSSDVIASHLHGNAPRGVNAGVKVPVTHTGGAAGTLSGGGVYSQADEAAILDGLWYVNVHTSTNPGGEIRGQVELEHAIGAPALSTWAILAMALVLGGTAALVFRRRSQSVA